MKTKPSSMPSSPQNPAFPFEIFDLILKNVSYSLRPDKSIVYHWDELRQCSIVCRAWVPICQALLFRSIELNQDCLSKPRRVERIVQLVKENLQIASYVKKIAYIVTPNDQGSVGNRSVSSLLHLPNLHSLDIRGNRFTLNFDHCRTEKFGFVRFWDAYIPSTSLIHLSLTYLNDPPLLEILSCPNLTSICLRDCAFSDWDPSFTTITAPSVPQIRSLSLDIVQNISYALLAFLPNLTELSLTHVTWYIPSKTPRDRFIIPLQGLQILRVDDTPSPLDGPTAWLPFLLSIADEREAKLFGNLKEITASPDSLEETEEVLHRILQHSPVLQDLDWILRDSSFIPKIQIHNFLPQDVGKIKGLHFMFSIGYYDWSCLNTIEALHQSLSMVASPASLQHLSLGVSLEATHLMMLFSLIRQLEGVDSALFTKSAMFPLLWLITFTIHVTYCGPKEHSPVVDEAMKANLYALIESAFKGFKRSPKSRLDIKFWLDAEITEEEEMVESRDTSYSSTEEST